MSESVRCLDCKRFSFERAGREWASKGVGCCQDHIAAMKFDPERPRLCGQHEGADPAAVAKRVEWMAKVRARQNEAEMHRRQHLTGNAEVRGCPPNKPEKE